MAKIKLENILIHWSQIVQRWSLEFIIFFALITIWGFIYVSNHLGVNTDTSDMMSNQLQWRQDSIKFRATFPEEVKTIMVVLEADIPEHAYLAQNELHKALNKHQDIFEAIYIPGGGEFFWKNGLLFLSQKDLEKKLNPWKKMMPFVGTLWNDASIEKLSISLSQASQRMSKPNTESLRLLTGFDRSLQGIEQNKPYTLSWQNIIQGPSTDPDALRQVIIVKPKLDYSNILPGKTAIQKIKDIVTELNLEDKYNTQIKLTGEVALAHEELLSVTEGAGLAAILSLLMVAIVLALSLRSFWLVFASLVSLVSGLLLTAAFAAITIGSLNLISIAFAVLYIGLGIDFSIHMCLRVREALGHGAKKETALQQASSDVGGSLVLCAITTSVGFYSFIPTNFAGVSELGLISGTGIIIGLVTNLTLLPAILNLCPIKHVPQLTKIKRFQAPIFLWPYEYPRAVIWTSVMLVIIALPFLRYVTFVADPMKLRAQKVESVKTFHELLDSKRFQAMRLSVLTDNLDKAKQLKVKLSDLSSVGEVKILSDWVPQEQTQKLNLLKQMGRNTQAARRKARQHPIQNVSLEQALKRLDKNLKHWESEDIPEVAAFRQSIDVFLNNYQKLSTQEKKVQRDALNTRMLSTWPVQIQRLEESMHAEKITLDNLPKDLIARWENNELYRVEIFPKDNISDLSAQKVFVDQVLSISPHATGLPVIHQKAALSVIEAFVTAFIYALSFITVLLFILFKKWQDVVLILAPLLVASLLTGAFTVLLKLPFNFANIIALPLMLGIGVDNGIHFVHRYYSKAGNTSNLLMTSTGKAVLASTLTTICSFGNLAFSAHVGMSSMGILLALGMTLTLVSTFTLLPACIALRQKIEHK